MTALLEVESLVVAFDGAPVINGIPIAVKQAEMAVKLQAIMGSVVSRKMLYQMPPADVLAKAKQDYGIDL